MASFGSHPPPKPKRRKASGNPNNHEQVTIFEPERASEAIPLLKGGQIEVAIIDTVIPIMIPCNSVRLYIIRSVDASILSNDSIMPSYALSNFFADSVFSIILILQTI